MKRTASTTPGEILAGNAELLRRAQTEADEDRVELGFQLIEGDVGTDIHSRSDLDT